MSPEDMAAHSRTKTKAGKRASPSAGGSGESQDGRLPTKRARKAINCEPCRNSKLKCDRVRIPACSSCVLRGTVAACYQGTEGEDAQVRGLDVVGQTLVDPAQELARMRQSIAQLEAHIFRNSLATPSLVPQTPQVVLPNVLPAPNNQSRMPKQESQDEQVPASGMFGKSSRTNAVYTGPTSAATHLLEQSDPNRNSEEASDRSGSASNDEMDSTPIEYDKDLLEMLPQVEVINGLISYYFKYCSWIYRHVNEPAFMEAWERFRFGHSSDRLTLCTVCLVMAVAVFYLPVNHKLLASISETHQELSQRLYDIMRSALARHQAESKKRSLEWIEMLLIRCHYLTLAKTDSEEIWTVKGELVTMGMAMGLHRDPGKLKMPNDVRERRRWAWWHIILLERWQAFMFGRPLSIATHHFDTLLPSYCPPHLSSDGRLYLPNIALFRLAFILGDIMDQAVSLKPVSYESVLANDRALTAWRDDLPRELDLDEFRVARSLASPIDSDRRLGVQSVIILTSYNHIRFTLHRPYAVASKADPTKTKTSQSLDIAVGAADRLITMVGQSRPDFVSNPDLAVPGHMNWGPLHCFSAAMFFSFQLIVDPEQPGAGIFRANIKKAIHTLNECRGLPLADKAFDILQTLAPLYSPDFARTTNEEKARRKASVLNTVRKLAFPYHDSPTLSRPMADSPRNPRESMNSPASNSLSPPGGGVMTPQQQNATISPGGHSQHAAMGPSMRSAHAVNSGAYSQTHSPVSPPGHPHSHPQSHHVAPSSSLVGNMAYASSNGYQQQQSQQQHHQQDIYGNGRYSAPSYAQFPDESNNWGASVGFGQGEWAGFMDAMQKHA